MNNRRELLKAMALLPLAACTTGLRKNGGEEVQQNPPAPAGWNPPGGELRLQEVKIRKVRAITTAPYRTGLVIVKVETDQPGLYGVGCATFTQRIKPVVSAVLFALKHCVLNTITAKKASESRMMGPLYIFIVYLLLFYD